MRILHTFLFILLFFSVLYPQMTGTRPTPYGFDVNAKPAIFYDIFLELNDGGEDFKLNFMIKIQYDLLYFIRIDSGYVSGYDISLYIKEMQSGETVYSQLWKETVREAKFDITNSRRHYHVNSKSFYVDFPPGKYQLNLALTDETTGREYKSNRSFSIPDFSQDYYLSDIIFLTEDKIQSAQIILDEDQTILEFNKDLYPYFQFKLSNALRVTVTSELYKIAEGKKELLRTRDKMPAEQGPIYNFNEVIERKNLEEGEYLLRYTITSGDFVQKVEKEFRIVWYQKPIPMYNMEMALLPMRYLLSDEEWNTISDFSEDEQKKWYKAYWKEKDPDPETPLNAVQVEFYHRVMEANKKFHAEQYEGWDTDRGKALILYGDPDRVRAKRFQDDAQPYEIWYYTQRNKKLIFIDQDEDGSYVLVSIENIGKDDDE